MDKLICLLLVGLLGGCGNKGPLYLRKETALTKASDRHGATLPIASVLRSFE